MHQQRQYIIAAIDKVIHQHTPLNRYSHSTIFESNHCAQLVRETVEGGTGMRANEWEVGARAVKISEQRGRDERFALDYETAGQQLGLVKPYTEVRIGDVLYWEYKKWGHTALYAGIINGEPHVLENSGWEPGQRRNQGAQLPLAGLGGAKPVYVFLSPLRLLGKPRQVIYPTTAIMRAETGEAPAAAPASPPASAKSGGGKEVHYLRARLRDANGNLLTGYAYPWGSVATDGQGRVIVDPTDGLPFITAFTEGEAKQRGLK